MSAEQEYLHGYQPQEQKRLYYQASLLEPSIYPSIAYPDAAHLLEVGSGVGAQTEIMLRRFPHLKITGIDVSEKQVSKAIEHLNAQPFFKGRYNLMRMNAEAMEFESEQFDAAFFCWILEHVPNPVKVLKETYRVLKPGSVIYATEVHNDTFHLYPHKANTQNYWRKYNELQLEMGGDPYVGAKLGAYLSEAGFKEITLTPIVYHYDKRSPKVKSKMIDFWRELLLSGADELIKHNKVTQQEVDAMEAEMRDLATHPDSVFYYSALQARAIR